MSQLDAGKLAAVRLWGATRFPYLATALFATRIVPVDRPGVVAVDPAWRIAIDPALISAWSVPELGSVLVHHVGHLLRDHAGRARALALGPEQADRWLQAADAEINDDLADAGLQFPIETVTPESLGLEPHHLAEEYFRAVGASSHPGDCGSGCDGLPRDWDADGPPGGVPPEHSPLLRAQVASEILRYARGTEAGSLPGGLQRWAEALLGARIDWRKALAAEIRRGLAASAGMVDYSYGKPSRRASAVQDVVLPGFVRPLPEVAVVLDTSGSMDQTLLGQALAEVQGLVHGLGQGRRRLRVIPCDAAAHRVQRIAAAQQLELLGGGGTNMGEGIAAACGLAPRPSTIVVLTDGFTPWPTEPPAGVKVVIGLLRQSRMVPPAWARVVQIEAA